MLYPFTKVTRNGSDGHRVWRAQILAGGMLTIVGFDEYGSREKRVKQVEPCYSVHPCECFEQITAMSGVCKAR